MSRGLVGVFGRLIFRFPFRFFRFQSVAISFKELHKLFYFGRGPFLSAKNRLAQFTESGGRFVVGRLNFNPRHVLFTYRKKRVVFAFFRVEPILQFVYHVGKDLRAEQFTKDFFFVFSRLAQDVDKLALSEHRNFSKLMFRQADDLRNFLIDVPFRVDGSVGERQFDSLRIFLLFRALTFGGSAALGRAPNDVQFPLLFERQSDEGFDAEIGKLTLKRHAVFHVGVRARLAVKRKDHRVENRRLARARVARDEEKILDRLGKIDNRLFAVRSERLHCQTDRPHFNSPPLRC